LLPQGTGGLEGFDEADFNEAGYLRRNPDVIEALRRGEFKTGYQHYAQYGIREGRTVPGAPVERRDALIATISGGSEEPDPGDFRCAVDTVIVAHRAGVMVIGWADDASTAIDCVRVISRAWHLVFRGASLVRVRRQDVEAALGGNVTHPFGFFGFVHAPDLVDMADGCTVEIWLKNDSMVSLQQPMHRVGEIELRNLVLGYLAGADFFGNQQIEGAAAVDRGLGRHVVAFNRAITSRITGAPYVERFGTLHRQPRGSIVVCLYGKSEFLAVQNCLFADRPGIEDYEFIYVLNSPELGEKLLREARASTMTYGLPQTVVVLPGNAGFGAANNAGVVASRSSRILNVNPDVFPRDPRWAARHTALLDERPAEETRLFGAALYYDDGSLMHGGMYFEMDTGISLRGGDFHPERVVRTEHYGKGAPAWAEQFVRPRPVPAVTGAFMSSDRAWYETLGGFNEDYVFGHYEDADLCLKSLQRGTPSWLQDLRLWHLEGKGSTRQPQHEGGSLVNRWLFSSLWGETIMDGLLGPAPTHPALAMPPVGTAASTETPAAEQPAQTGSKRSRRQRRAVGKTP
jgi:hypothetical protein